MVGDRTNFFVNNGFIEGLKLGVLLVGRLVGYAYGFLVLQGSVGLIDGVNVGNEIGSYEEEREGLKDGGVVGL